MTVFEIAAIVGAITGSTSLAVVILKSIRDKHRLTFEKEQQSFFPGAEADYHTSISIGIKIHNKGTKPTTIHYSKLAFDYNSKHMEVEANNVSLVISPHSTITFHPSLNLAKAKLIIHGEITNCVLTINHTYDTKELDLGTIKQYQDPRKR